MVPWLFLQGFLASILASLACYYLILFPLKNSCISDETSGKKEANNLRTRAALTPLISSTSYAIIRQEEEAATSSATSYSCQALLWYSAIMILSLLILFYYFYIVNVTFPVPYLAILKCFKRQNEVFWKSYYEKFL